MVVDRDVQGLGSPLAEWITAARKRGARCLVISWCPVDRDWQRHTFLETNPPLFQWGLEFEVFRIALKEGQTPDTSHVYLAEEP